MRVPIALALVRRQERHRLAALIENQNRMVAKSVGMIVHKIAPMQKGSVFAER
jgi:hypothetical protein